MLDWQWSKRLFDAFGYSGVPNNLGGGENNCGVGKFSKKLTVREVGINGGWKNRNHAYFNELLPHFLSYARKQFEEENN